MTFQVTVLPGKTINVSANGVNNNQTIVFTGGETINTDVNTAATWILSGLAWCYGNQWPTLPALTYASTTGNLPIGQYQVGGAIYTWDGVNLMTAGSSNPVAQIFNPSNTESFPYAITPAASASAAPTPIDNGNHGWAIVPAQVGDVIEVDIFLPIYCNQTGSTAVLSVWSIGGYVARDWSSGVTGLQSVPGFQTIANNNGNNYTNASGKIINKVLASDIDNNGNVTFRVYLANGVTGSYTFNVNPSSSSFPAGVCIVKNLKANQPGVTPLPTQVFKYPGGSIGADQAIITTGQTFSGPLVHVTNLDYKVAANAMDIIEVDLSMCVNDALMNFLVLSVNGNAIRQWSNSELWASMAAIQGNSAGNLQSVGGVSVKNKIANRVIPSDIGADGTVVLQVWAFNGNNSRTAWTIYGEYNGIYSNLSYAQFTLWPREKIFLLAENGPVWPQEPSIWVDNNNIINMLFDVGGVSGSSIYNGLTWATLATPKSVPVIQATNLFGQTAYDENSVWYENGILYIFFGNNGSGNIDVAIGTTPTNAVLQSTPAFAATQVASIINSGSIANTAVSKGPGGLYYMHWEANPSASSASGSQQTNPLAGTYSAGHFTTWQIGVATATVPQGPYTYVPGSFPIVNLDAASLSTCGGPYTEWTGEYFRMLYHSASVASGTVPLQIYAATSQDGINWNPTAVNSVGNLTPLSSPHMEITQDACGDAAFLRWNGQTYLFNSDYLQGSGPQWGGIEVNDPSRCPVKLADSVSMSSETDNPVAGMPPTALTVGSSPYSYTNTSSGIQQLLISGGTVSSVQFKRGSSGTAYTAYSGSNCALVLSPGDIGIITYSSVPTIESVQIN